jgi:hypothetical protein
MSLPNGEAERAKRQTNKIIPRSGRKSLIKMRRYIKSFFTDGRLHIYSLLLFVSTFLWMALPYNSGSDMSIQKWVGAAQMFLPDSHKPASDEIIFIDVSKSKYLVPLNEDSTENDVITNRKYLAQLFTLLTANPNKIKYVLCDVQFDIPTPDDSLLVQSISALGDKFLTIDVYVHDSYHKNSLELRSATASVELQKGTVYKIPYFGMYGDTLVPYKMYADLDKGKVYENLLFSYFKGKGIAFNNQINDYPIRRSDFTDGNYVKIGLGELVSVLELSPDIFEQYLQNRYLLIGDFENDVHNTYLSKQPGTLILFNAYQHLHLNRQILSIWYLVILYIFLHWIVWLQTGKRRSHLKFKFKIKYFEAFEFSVNILSISSLLIVFTFLSSILFTVNISIFHLIAIFSFVDLAEFIWKKRIKSRIDK